MKSLWAPILILCGLSLSCAPPPSPKKSPSQSSVFSSNAVFVSPTNIILATDPIQASSSQVSTPSSQTSPDKETTSTALAMGAVPKTNAPKTSVEVNEAQAMENSRSPAFVSSTQDPNSPPVRPGVAEALAATPGFMLPYSLGNVISTHGECRGRKMHRGLDLGGVGVDAGLGTPVRSMTRARILQIGRPIDDPRRFGRPDTRSGTTFRRQVELPRSKEIEGYGLVRFFTRNRGHSKMGTVISTMVIGGPLDGHKIRYMHLGAIRPDLQVGDVIVGGEEVGLMGGTAVQSSFPHVHIDISTPRGRRVRIEPLLGLPADRRSARRCRRKKRRSKKRSRKRRRKKRRSKKRSRKKR